ncbi:unnamed protein product [Sphagnum tenellum]
MKEDTELLADNALEAIQTKEETISTLKEKITELETSNHWFEERAWKYELLYALCSRKQQQAVDLLEVPGEDEP